ncbi:hypothetical protein ABT086_28215, partial [Streptomyces mirabilis]
MGSIPTWARVYVVCVVLAAVACLAPLPAVHAPWWIVAVLAALYAGCERIPFPHSPKGAAARVAERGAPRGLGTFLPVLLAGAFLLPPSAAALKAAARAARLRGTKRKGIDD